MNPSPAHIAVVDDEADLREMIADYLRRHNFVVSEVDGGTALDALMAERPLDLVLLDVSMPGEDGVSIARRLRARGPVGIVMLTAHAETLDRVVGLEVGADDYVTKPFDLRELLARVRAVLRRTRSSGGPGEGDGAGSMGRLVRFGCAVLDLDAARLVAPDGGDIPLTAMEFDLLRTFAEHPGKPLSRDRLLDLAHNRDPDCFDRSIDSRIVRLRRKIEENPAKPQVLKSVRGVGYVFKPDASF